MGANLIGADLYRRLKSYLERFLAGIYEECPKSGEPLLDFYTRKWNQYTLSAKLVNNVFSYLNRHWVKREIDMGGKHKGVFDIYTVSRPHLCGSAFSAGRLA
jgi:cullin 1